MNITCGMGDGRIPPLLMRVGGKKRKKEKKRIEKNEKSERSGNPEEKWKDGGAGGGC